MAASTRDGGSLTTEYGRLSSRAVADGSSGSMQLYDKAPADLNYGEGPPEATDDVAHAYGNLGGSDAPQVYDRPPVGGAARSSQYEQPGDKLDSNGLQADYDLPESALL